MLPASWPCWVEAGSWSNELVALTPTLAESMTRKLPASVGPGTFSFVGTLLKSKQSSTIRTSLVQNSYGGGLGFRHGDWKPRVFEGGAGRLVGQPYGVHGWNPYDYDRTHPCGQLYNLAGDLGELRNYH